MGVLEQIHDALQKFDFTFYVREQLRVVKDPAYWAWNAMCCFFRRGCFLDDNLAFPPLMGTTVLEDCKVSLESVLMSGIKANDTLGEEGGVGGTAI